MKNIILGFLLLLSLPGFTQNTGEEKNAIDISLFKFQDNPLTYQGNMAPLFVTGISYERRISKWSWVVNIEYGENKTKDGCYGCPDAFSGTGILTEFAISAGYNFTLNQYSESKFKWFFGTDIYTSYLSYQGELSGGWGGTGKIVLDNNQLYAGVLQRVGLTYSPIPLLRISAIADYRLGWGTLDRFSDWRGRRGSDERITFPHLKVGFLF